MKTTSDVSILFVDDEPEILNSLKRFLRREAYQTHFVASGREALGALAVQPVDIVVSDLRMPEMDGLSLLKQVRLDYPAVIRLILSATQEIPQIIEAFNAGEVYRFLTKPLDPESFRQTLRSVVDYHLLHVERRETTLEIEKRLLRARPPHNLDGADVAALLIPSEDLDGDFSDYFTYNRQQVDILVGDVMGKGAQSAIVAAGIKLNFAKALALYDCRVTPRMSCPNYSYDSAGFAQILTRVHAACVDDLLELEMFCTLEFARLDLAAGRLYLFDLGHCPVIHFRAETCRCSLLKGENMPLGMVKEAEYRAIKAYIQAGDVLVFHSDGVTETRSTAGELFGIDRLTEIVSTNHRLSAAQLVDTIRAEVAAFSGRGRFDDDFTCVAVCIERTGMKYSSLL